MSGRLIGIAWRPERRAPMQTVDSIDISLEAGVAGDHKGAKFKRRAVTILAREDWEAALADLGPTMSRSTGRRGVPTFSSRGYGCRAPSVPRCASVPCFWR